MAIKIVNWLCRLIAAIILLQTLFFKFSGAEESVYIFSAVQMEPWGRYLTGLAELLAAILILVPRLTVYGALLGAAIMAGAILTHLFILGVEVMGDGGLLFVYACTVLFCCLFLIYHARHVLAKMFTKKLITTG